MHGFLHRVLFYVLIRVERFFKIIVDNVKLLEINAFLFAHVLNDTFKSPSPVLCCFFVSVCGLLRVQHLSWLHLLDELL